MSQEEILRIGIIGGGAGGFFCAIRAAEVAKANSQPVEVVILEATNSLLKKVKISGGGRCNVTHNQFDPRELSENYPRGKRELLSPFQRFQPKDTVQWLADRGVETKAESDGRMFPVTDSSQTIIDCFLNEAKKLGVEVRKNKMVEKVDSTKEGFRVFIKDEADPVVFDKLLIATGSGKIGYKLVTGLGHKLTEMAPSLFTFKISDPILSDLAGTSFANSKLKLKIANEKDFTQQGPLLITHWGLSGPALLKLSAWAAREMKRSDYQAKLQVNWLGIEKENEVRDLIEGLLSQQPNAQIKNMTPDGLTKRFWQQFLSVLDIPEDKKCSEVSKKEKNRLIAKLFSAELTVTGKSRFKEEFVECGGVSLKEIDFKTMQSKICRGLYFSGEVLDVDGITGGFNFQNAWTTAWIAGEHMVLN